MLDFYEGWVQIEVDLAVTLVLPILTVNPPITPDIKIRMVGYIECEMIGTWWRSLQVKKKADDRDDDPDENEYEGQEDWRPERSGEEEEYESDTCWIEEGSEGILEDKKTGQNCNLQN